MHTIRRMTGLGIGLALLLGFGCDNKNSASSSATHAQTQESPERNERKDSVFCSPMGKYSVRLELKPGVGEWTYIMQPTNLMNEAGKIEVPQTGMDTFVRQFWEKKSDLVIISWAPAKDMMSDLEEAEHLFIEQNRWTRVSGPEDATIGDLIGKRETFTHTFRGEHFRHYVALVHCGGRSYTVLATSNRSPDTAEEVLAYFCDNLTFEE